VRSGQATGNRQETVGRTRTLLEREGAEPFSLQQRLEGRRGGYNIAQGGNVEGPTSLRGVTWGGEPAKKLEWRKLLYILRKQIDPHPCFPKGFIETLCVWALVHMRATGTKGQTWSRS